MTISGGRINKTDNFSMQLFITAVTDSKNGAFINSKMRFTGS